MDHRPVLYLDIDDTLVSWEGGQPHAPPGGRDFMLWALPRFEVRWLTNWCPSGVMAKRLVADLAHMFQMHPERLRCIRGFEWQSSKLDGVAWLEHIVFGRRFVWMEDERGFTGRERSFLARHLLLDSYHHCNVTEDPLSLRRTHAWLRSWLAEVTGAAA